MTTPATTTNEAGSPATMTAGDAPAPVTADTEALRAPELFTSCQRCHENGEDECCHRLADMRWDGEMWSCEECWSPDEADQWETAKPVPDYDALAAENARLRAAGTASWIAGRDAGADACQKVAEEAKGYGIPQMTMGASKCADDIRALTPPADDKAALDAMIAEARRDDLAVIEALQKRLRDTVGYIDKGHVEMARNVAAIQKDQDQ